ncbi:MAG: sugar ABC transporter permease [Spirochaetales bacterium]|nr:sugar ABC transporter permease [Spirochaetales bacterium]
MKTIKQSKIKQDKLAYLFILPFVAVFVIFKIVPILYGLFISFLDRNSVKKAMSTAFVGFKNFQKVFTSDTFWKAFGNSLVFAIIYIVLRMVLGFFIAILLNKRFRGRTAVRTMFYMPYVTNVIAIGIVFQYLLDPFNGPVNAIFKALGMEGPLWLLSPTFALPVTAVVAVWIAVTFNVITILAALQDIPQSLYEVADIEGANEWQKIRYITFPLLIPTLFTLLTLVIIASFKSYNIIMALTEGGPGGASRTLSFKIYEDSFLYNYYSVGAAESVFFATFIIIINRVFNRIRSSWESRN